MKLLAIESSCDDTSAAVLDGERHILSNIIHSQDSIHRPYGGVVPELASREHIARIIPTIDEAMRVAMVSFSDLDALAVTYGPGLIGSLLVGLQAVKGIAAVTGLPWIGIHHIEGHLSASLLAKEPPPYPHAALIVSGGHTLLLRVDDFGQYSFLGSTRDDAAGEAFDKVSKILGLGFPGGVALERAAKGGDPKAIAFPRPMRSGKSQLDMSFSGLKTAACNELSARPIKSPAHLADFAASFIEAVVDTLVEKSMKALKREKLPGLVLGGGVSANSRLREKMAMAGAERNVFVHLPERILCTDNAAMVGAAALCRLERGERSSFELTAEASLPIAFGKSGLNKTPPRCRRRGLREN